MAIFTSPLRFTPFPRPMVWGGRKLASLLNKTLPTEENYGESWEISDHPLHRSVVAMGPLAGATLHSLIEQHPQDILGTGRSSFPWLIKFLDARDWLSVQVHPDDALAQKLRPGESGKTEAWFVVAAEPGSRIYAGVKSGVQPDEFREAVRAGTVADLLHSFTPRAGDYVFLPAGTVHAVGGGVVLAEVQQNSDVTFRLFDWNRVDAQGKPRQLHVEEGLAAIDWRRGPVLAMNMPMQGEGAGEGDFMRPLGCCRYFDLSFFRHRGPVPLGKRGIMRSLVILSGAALLEGEKLRAGEVCLLPACLPELTLEPAPLAVGLICSLPEYVGALS